jgi:hypothetical protein
MKHMKSLHKMCYTSRISAKTGDDKVILSPKQGEPYFFTIGKSEVGDAFCSTLIYYFFLWYSWFFMSNKILLSIFIFSGNMFHQFHIFLPQFLFPSTSCWFLELNNLNYWKRSYLDFLKIFCIRYLKVFMIISDYIRYLKVLRWELELWHEKRRQ